MVLSALASIGVLLLIGSVFVGLIFLVINLLSNREKGLQLQMKTLWISYLYLITFVSLLVALFGGARLIKSGLSYKFEPQFSYTLTEYNSDDYLDEKEQPIPVEESWLKGYEKVTVDGKDYYFDAVERKSDIIDGATLFLSLIIIFAIHRALIVRLDEKKDSDVVSFWARAYNFVSLAIYGVLSLVVIPTTIYSTVKYFVDGASLLGGYNAPLPGEAIGAFLVIVPVWVFFLLKMVNYYKK